MLSYRTNEANGVMVLTAEEDVEPGGERPAPLRERLYNVIEAHADTRFAIDLGAINYLTSGDIGFLITLKRRIEGRRGKLVLFGVDLYVQDILRTMRLDQLFTITESFSDASNRLSNWPTS